MTTALVVDRTADGKVFSEIRTLAEDQLPTGGEVGGGEVVVAVDYSCLNYKDGLCLTGRGGLVKSYPHVPGIDFAGVVVSSGDARYRIGDRVVLTGWRVGELYWGGYATHARVKADWLVPLPAGLSTRQAMVAGTAGLTAMLALMALERQGLTPQQGEVLVTGAGGGVGSIATALLANLGFRVAAVTGRPAIADSLRALGAERIILRTELNESSMRPLERETWAGCLDSVGGVMLARILGQMRYGASVAAIGLAGGADLPASVIPFLLRGVNLLGIDSVMQPFDRRQQAWARLVTDTPFDRLEPVVQEAGLSDLPGLGQAILEGAVRGRVIVNLRA